MKKKRYVVTNSLWNALEKLASNAKMDWFYEETYSRKTLTADEISDVYCAFIKQNFFRLEDKEILLCYDFFVIANVMEDCGRNELIEYFKEVSL